MAIFTNLTASQAGEHGMFESSRIKASIVGHVYDVIFDEVIDNGVLVKLGDYTGEGLQTREGEVATIKDKVAVTGAPAIIKDAITTSQNMANNFYNAAGIPVKCYELVEEDIFAVASYQITKGTVAKDAFIVANGDGGYEVVESDPSATHGFVGKIHSISVGDYYTMVRIEVIKNETVA